MKQPPYVLQFETGDVTRVRLDWPAGRALLDLVLLSTTHGPGRADVVLEVRPAEVRALDNVTVEISQSARSALWQRKQAVLRSYEDRLEYWIEVEGQGTISGLELFAMSQAPPARGWRKLNPWRVRGPDATRHASRRRFASVCRLGPDQSALGLGDEGRWVIIGPDSRPGQAGVGAFASLGGAEWCLGLELDEPVRVNGTWRSPTVVILPTVSQAAGTAAYADWLARLAQVPRRLSS